MSLACAYRFCSTGGYAIVTGASTGIGLELAKQLIDAGFNLLITGFGKNDCANAKAVLEARAKPEQTIEVGRAHRLSRLHAALYWL